MEYEGETFEGKTLVLDGNTFQNCVLQECQLIYRGGTPPMLHANTINNCTWTFEEAAGNTLQFMRALVTDNADFGRMIRESLSI